MCKLFDIATAIYYTVIDTPQRKSTGTVSLIQNLHGTENQEQKLDEHYWAQIDDYEERHREAAFALNGTTVTNTGKEEKKEERRHRNLLFL